MKRIKVVKSTCGDFNVLEIEGRSGLRKGTDFVMEVGGKKTTYKYLGTLPDKFDSHTHIVRLLENGEITYVQTEWFDNSTRKAWVK